MCPAAVETVSVEVEKVEAGLKVALEPTGSGEKALEQAAKHCPVHQSLHPDVKIPVEFSWGG